MNKENDLQNQLKAVRTRQGLSQQDLATAAGVARQTIGGIETGSYALSMIVALRLARALGCTVDDLFWLEDNLPRLQATLIDRSDETTAGDETYVALARVGERWIASPLVGDSAYRREMIPADGVGVKSADGTMSIRLLDQPEALTQTVSLAGCAPALSLWAQSAERWHPGLRIHWAHANSMAALARLAAREVHLAGVHLHDRATGADNAPSVRQALNGEAAVLVNLGVWEEGFLVAPGNPRAIQSGADLARPDVVIANREAGAGARILLDALLTENAVAPTDIRGYASAFPGHFEVAEEVRAGRADAAISTAAVARTYSLTFVPLQSVRYDLALRQESLEVISVQHLLATLHHRWVRSQLSALGGYDTRLTGEVIEVV